MNIINFLTKADTVETYMAKIHTLTFIGIMFSFFTAFVVYSFPVLSSFVIANVFVIFFIQLAFIFVLGYIVNNSSFLIALITYLLFTGLLGITMFSVFSIYTMGSIVGVFVATAIMFAVLSIYGLTTTYDFSKFEKILFLSLLGIITVLIMNIFIVSSVLSTCVSIVGVVVFAVFIVYNTQKLKNAYNESYNPNIIVIGATSLYLDFINTFSFLLNLIGVKK